MDLIIKRRVSRNSGKVGKRGEGRKKRILLLPQSGEKGIN